MITFSTNKRHNGKIGRVLNNQYLKYPLKVKNRESSNFAFLLNCVITDMPYFFSLGGSNISHTDAALGAFDKDFRPSSVILFDSELRAVRLFTITRSNLPPRIYSDAAALAVSINLYRHTLFTPLYAHTGSFGPGNI